MTAGHDKPRERAFDSRGPEARANALAEVLKPFAHPRATTRAGFTDEVDKDVLTVEVTIGDWWRALTALGLFDAEMAEMYAGSEHLSEGFTDELKAIAEAVHSVR